MAGLKILFVSSEVYPLAKTGGLADVAGSLPKALLEDKNDVRIVMPRYKRIDKWDRLETDFGVPMYKDMETAVVKTTKLPPENKVPVYLIDSYKYFDRSDLYGYADDAERFIFFSRAVVEMLKAINWKPDVIHCNDWQTALVPTFLRTIYKHDPFFKNVGLVFTIHNIQYQGITGPDDFRFTDLPQELMHHERLEFYGALNLMKGGIIYSDVVNTVSEGYAKEIQTPEYGYRLDGLLRAFSYKLTGVLNGLDYSIWDPAKDPLIYKDYDKATLDKKGEDKAGLQRELNLPEEKDVPVLGTVGRLSDQKGYDLLTPIIGRMLEENIQFVLLGTGEEKFHIMLREFKERHANAGILLKYDEKLAHKIYAGSDIFLMPSRFEPCGLGQMIALKYGAVPVVRHTGGLADTITDYTKNPEKGNGFDFVEYTEEALEDAIRRALKLYNDDKEAWKRLQLRGMSESFSWHDSAKKYEALYQKALEDVQKVQ